MTAPHDESKPRDPYAPSPAPPRDLDHDGRLGTFEAHPEWYGLHAGARSAAIHGESGDNDCTSNRDATRELAASLVRSLAGGRLRHADLDNFWMLDQGRWCECDRCREQGSPSDRTSDAEVMWTSRIGWRQRQDHSRPLPPTPGECGSPGSRWRWTSTTC